MHTYSVSNKTLNRQNKRSYFYCLVFILGITFCSAINAQNTEFEYITSKQSYQYTVAKTGENYSFKFKKNPIEKGNNTAMLKAGYHVLKSIYKDTSINKIYSESYIREGAKCYVIDSHFYTYTLCFLPNSYSPGKKDRFWGFTTQMPNWKWLVTRILLPVLIAFSLIFYALTYHWHHPK